MSKSIYFMLLAALLSTSFRLSLGHGRLLEPPARNSLWRFPDQFPEAVPDYDDNGLNCGGRSYQHFEVGGKCGICGDKWIPDSTEPRPREAGGRYAKGIIARHYSPGSVINVTIQVTASHKGYFQFRLCPNNDVTKPATHDCLNEHLLRFEDGSTKFYYGSTVGYYHMRVRLPSNVTCSQCVLQWKWITGNSWGVSPSGEGCVGCGPQEEFYGCSDISIGDTPGSAGADPVLNDPEVGTNNDHNPTTTVRVSDPEGWTTAELVGGDGSKCRPTELYANTAGMQEWCVEHCSKGDCPKSHCVCPGQQPAEETSVQPSVQSSEQPAVKAAVKPAVKPALQPAVQPNEQPSEGCHAFGVFAGDPAMEEWCAANCALGFCPDTHCTCGVAHDAKICKAVGVWASISGMDRWCQVNCQLGFCPASHCLCN